jgi:hypothetical protein
MGRVSKVADGIFSIMVITCVTLSVLHVRRVHTATEEQQQQNEQISGQTPKRGSRACWLRFVKLCLIIQDCLERVLPMEDRDQASAVAAAAQPKHVADLLMGHAHEGWVLCAWCGQGLRICMPDNVNRWP